MHVGKNFRSKMHGRIFSNGSPREYNLKEREMTDGEHHLNTFSFFWSISEVFVTSTCQSPTKSLQLAAALSTAIQL